MSVRKHLYGAAAVVAALVAVLVLPRFTAGAAEADTTVPTTPGTPVIVSQSGGAALLRWSVATDNVGVVGYDLVRVGTVEAIVNTPTTNQAFVNAGGDVVFTY